MPFRFVGFREMPFPLEQHCPGQRRASVAGATFKQGAIQRVAISACGFTEDFSAEYREDRRTTEINFEEQAAPYRRAIAMAIRSNASLTLSASAASTPLSASARAMASVQCPAVSRVTGILA